MRKVTGIALSLLLVLGIWGSLEAQKIKTVDGVKIIENGKKPKPPKGVPTTFSLKVEATIGYDEDPDKSLAEVGFFVVADNGRIYTTDIKDRKVKVFDVDGNYVGQIGREGQGPGELGIPSVIQLTPDNELMIEDATNQRVSFFTLDGEFVKEMSLAKSGALGLTTLMLDKKGNFAGRQIGLEEQQMYMELKKFDQELNPLFSIAKTEFAIPNPAAGTKMDIMEFIQVYMFDSAGNLMYGVNKDYEIQKYDAEGKLFLSIQKDYKPVKVTEEDIADFEERMAAFSGMAQGVNLMDLFNFPDVFPPYQGFFLDSRDNIYVRTWEKGEGEDEYWTDVFDKDGIFFARFVHKSELRIVDGDRAFGIEENEDGFRLIKRYSVTWSK